MKIKFTLYIFLFILLHSLVGQNRSIRQAAFPDLVSYDLIDGKKTTLIVKEKFIRLATPILWDDNLVITDVDYQGVYNLKDFQIDPFGYQFYISKPYKVEVGIMDNRMVVVMGAGYFDQCIYQQGPWERKYTDFINRIKRERAEPILHPVAYYGFVDDGIKEITAWSELSEEKRGKRTYYTSEGMRKPFILFIEEVYSIEINPFDQPWAEGVEGPGIGGTIDIEFTRPTKEIDILNGYVDLGRRNLYKENNRLKKIQIDSEDPKFTTTAVLEDVVKFHEVPLPKATTKVRITILEVYKGTKYDDTCITKIFIPQQYIRPRAEYEAEIEKALKAVGYLK